MRDVAFRTRALLDFLFLFLKIHRHGDVRHTAKCHGGAAGKIDDIFHMVGAHDALVIHANIDEQLVERDILLRMSPNQVVKLQTGDRQNWLMIKLGVIQAV